MDIDCQPCRLVTSPVLRGTEAMISSDNHELHSYFIVFSTLNSKQRVKLSLSRMFASYHFNFTQISLQIKRSNYERRECQRRLPVRQRTEHKMLTFRSLGGSVTRYLSDLIELWRPTRALRSSTSLDLVVPATRLKVYADRTFLENWLDLM